MADILLADDDPQIRNMVRAFLEKSGHTVTEVVNGADALRHLQSHRPDLMITDMYMPDMDGVAVIRELRGKPGAPAIIGISGSQEPHTFEIVRMLGAKATLDKPFTGADLMEMVERVLAETGKK